MLPVTIAANRGVTKVLKKNSEDILRKHPIDSLQKTAVLGTSQMIREVLQCET
jgi:hypothetical protein